MTELLRLSFGEFHAGRAPSVQIGGASPRTTLGPDRAMPDLDPWTLAMFGTGYGQLTEFGPNTLHDFGSI